MWSNFLIKLNITKESKQSESIDIRMITVQIEMKPFNKLKNWHRNRFG